jgi:DMSO/TMAO reductase YedYZ molybdopterin-dependent catalytic subunit
MVVPERYGNASVKWIQRVVLTNNPQSNDPYAKWNNDTVSQLKTYAHFIESPKSVRAGQPFAITGLAQVGMSGLSKGSVLSDSDGEALAGRRPLLHRRELG